MTQTGRRCWLAGLLVVLTGSFAAMAAEDRPFDPLFYVKDIRGPCLVAPPGSTQSVSVVRDHAFPYGSHINLPTNAGAVVMFAPETYCILTNNAEATMEAPRDNRRVVRLHAGMCTTTVEENLRPAKEFAVTTVTGVSASPVSNRFSVTVSPDPEGETVLVASEGGIVGVTGPHFAVLSMTRDDAVTVRTSRDGTFTRLTATRGAVDVTTKDNAGGTKVIPLKPGQSLKIWAQKIGDTGKLAVRILGTTPEGLLLSDTKQSTSTVVAYTEDAKSSTESQ